MGWLSKATDAARGSDGRRLRAAAWMRRDDHRARGHGLLSSAQQARDRGTESQHACRASQAGLERGSQVAS